MRLVQATVPPWAVSEVTGILDEHGIDYFATTETENENYDTIVYVSIPDEEVESLLKYLSEAGLDADDHVVVIDTQVDIFGETAGFQEDTGEYERIAAAELQGQTENLIPDIRTYVVMLVLSAVVATTGLVLNSPAVVVGAMVLAPLFGPTMSASVGTVIDESDLFVRGVKYQLLGVAVTVVSATVFAWLVKTAYLLPPGLAVTTTPQIVARLSPDLLSLVVAFVAGVAGVLSIATGSGLTLVGVMMAAALLPPAAVVGIGITWSEPMVAVNAGVLLAVNIIALNLAGLITLWYIGYRPGSWPTILQTRRELLKRGGVLLVALLVLSAFLVNVTYSNVRQAQIRDSVETAVREVLDDPAYQNVSLVNINVVEDQPALVQETDRVVVTVGRPPGESIPNLRERIDEAVSERVGRDIRVDVRVVLFFKEPAESGGAPADLKPTRASDSGLWPHPVGTVPP